jgi:VanZ family protein
MTNLYRVLRRKWIWWTLFLIWLGAVFYASSMTGQEVAPVVPTFFLHKVAHFIAYGSGTVILALSLRLSTKWSWRKIAVISVVVVSLYGATDEWHQLYTPGRDGTVRDWAIDTASGIVGVGVLLWVKDRLKQRLAPKN